MMLSDTLRWLGTVIGLALITVLSGCVSTPPWPEAPAATVNVNLNQRLVLNQVPFYAQERYQCGPASLAMMLNAQGLQTDPETLRELVYLPGRRGTLKVELVAAGRSHGMVVYELDGTLDSLLTEVAAGNPVLVMQNLRLDWWPQWHFAVVIGFDEAERKVILHTDTRERHEETLEVFTATWKRADNWAAVMLPPEHLPATAKPLDYLRAVNDLETTGRTNAANAAYQTAERAWPDQPAAVLGQGNIAYQLADWKQATHHYLRLTERFPQLAAGWNNLAHSLARHGCEREASTAAHCAHQLKPERFGGAPDAEASSSAECPPVRCPNLE